MNGKKNICPNHWLAVVFFYIFIIIRLFCPRTAPSLQTQEPRLQLCSKAGIPPQTQEPRLIVILISNNITNRFLLEGQLIEVAAVLLGMDRCGSFPLLSAHHSSFSIGTDLKVLKRTHGHQLGGEESRFD